MNGRDTAPALQRRPSELTENVKAFLRVAGREIDTESEDRMGALSVEDVKKLIKKAQVAKADPVGMGMGLFAGLGENASVTGDVLQQALEESSIPMPADAKEILGTVQSLSKKGDQVQLAFGSQLSPVVKGTQLRLGPTISATLQKFPDGLALADISGISVNKFVWIDVQRVQFHETDGKRSVRVDTNFGGKEFKLP
jgi:hypothetical protein